MLLTVVLTFMLISGSELARAGPLISILESDIGGEPFTLWKVSSWNFVVLELSVVRLLEHRDGFIEVTKAHSFSSSHP